MNLVEHFYLESQKYYEREYGFPLRDIPVEILQGRDFKKITVERALMVFTHFNLSPNDSSIFYHALLLDALPLPPDVIEIKQENSVEYLFQGTYLRNIIRPTYFYVKDILEHLKSKTAILTTMKLENLRFFDSLERPFTVNMKRLYQEWLGSHKDREFINYLGKKEEAGDEKKERESLVLKGEKGNAIRDIMSKNYGIEMTTEITSSR